MKVGGFAASLDKTIQPGFARGKQANRPVGEETIQPRLWREEMHPLLVLCITFSPEGENLSRR